MREIFTPKTPRKSFPQPFIHIDNGTPKAILQNTVLSGLSIALAYLNIEVIHDIRADKDLLRYKLDSKGELSPKVGDWIPWTPIAETLPFIKGVIFDRCVVPAGEKNGQALYKNANFSYQELQLSLGFLASRYPYDSFVQWLEQALPPWDGNERLDHYIKEMFGTKDGYPEDICKWAASAIPIGAITRAYEPGYKIDEMIILVGEQGIGKSQLIIELLPPEFRGEWFTDAFHIDDQLKKQVETAQGRVLVEIPEMVGLKRADWQKFKRFLTSVNDGGVRLAYRRDAKGNSPRQFIIIGTSDKVEETLQYDEAGYRRFVIVELSHRCDNVVEYMKLNRDQIWAEALYRYRKNGAQVTLPPELHDIKESIARKHAIRNDVLHESIASIKELVRKETGETVLPGTKLKLRTIMIAIGYREADALAPSSRQGNVKRALRDHGWEYKKKVRGPQGQGGYWIAPSDN